MALQPVESGSSIWTLGDRIRKIRRGLNLGQDEFGALLGVKKAAVSKWERDDGEPEHLLDTVATMSSLAREAGLDYATPAWILDVVPGPSGWYAARDSNSEPTDSGFDLHLWDEVDIAA